MRFKIQRLIIICVVVAIMLMALKALITGYYGLDSIIKAAMYLAPVLGVSLVLAGPIWVGLVLGNTMLTTTVPLPVLFRLEPGLIFTCAICGMVMLLRVITQKGRATFGSSDSLAMKVLSAIVILRFAHDRPGSLRSGASSGGGGEAVIFVAGCLAFLLVAMLCSEEWNPRRNLKTVVGVGIVALMLHLAVGFSAGLFNHFSSLCSFLYGRQLWFLCPLVFAYAHSLRRKHPGSATCMIFFYGVMFVILFFGVFSIHRSRLLFSAGILLGVSYAFGQFKKTLILLVAALCLGTGAMLFANSGQIPPRAARALSTILPSRVPDGQYLAANYGVSGEMGWKSPFRARLMEIASGHIRRHPLAGKGFVLTLDELWQGAYLYDASLAGALTLAASGMYHNSVVELAVFCGLPAALAFCYAYCLGLWRFTRKIRSITDEHFLILVAGMLGFFAAESGQMLMNGSASDFAVICILLAVMRGIVVRLTDRQADNPTSLHEDAKPSA